MGTQDLGVGAPFTWARPLHRPPSPLTCTVQPTPEELQRFIDMEPTRNFGDQAMFMGAQAPEGKLPASAPSRVLLQQLHDAGQGMRMYCCWP